MRGLGIIRQRQAGGMEDARLAAEVAQQAFGL